MTALSASAILLTIASVGESEGLLETAVPPTWFPRSPSWAFGPTPLANDGPLAAGGMSPLEPPMLGGAWPGSGVTLEGGMPGFSGGKPVFAGGMPGRFGAIWPMMSGIIPGGMPWLGIAWIF